MHADLTTEDRLRALVAHAEYGHLEGQDYDTAVALVVEVRRLRAGIEAHRERFRNRAPHLHFGTPAQAPNENLWELLDVGPSDRKDNQ